MSTSLSGDDSAAPLRGRFAPSPTGPLHLGSLVTALASWLDMRSRNGEWLVRIDDIDPPREVPGSADTILRQLEAHGLDHDGPVHYQSSRHQAYQAVVDQLLEQGHAFYCSLSRRQLAELGGVHPGPEQAVPPGPDRAIRLRVPERPLCFPDRLQGRYCVDLARTEGPFVIRRRDGLFAYQLASGLDEAALGITEVMRGADLIDSTARQIHVLDCLGLESPGWAHLPVITDRDGNKLSKSRGAAALSQENPSENLRRALACLRMPAPDELRHAPVRELLAWALTHWQPQRLAGEYKHLPADPA